MRVLTALVTGIALHSVAAHAEMLVDAAKVEAFLKQKRRCYFAVGSEWTRRNLCKVGRCVFPTIACFENLEIGTGSIHERRGCAYSTLDVRNGRYTPPSAPARYIKGQVIELISSKNCEQGGFSEVLKLPMKDFARGGKVTTVRSATASEPRGLPTKTVILYSAEPAALEAWSAQSDGH